jgi:hypothetical protein
MAKTVADPQRVADLAPQSQCSLPGCERLVPSIDQSQLSRRCLEQVRLRRSVEAVGEPERALVLSACLPMSGQFIGALRCSRCIVQHRLPVACRLGVVRHPRIVRLIGLLECRKSAPMEFCAAVAWDRLFEGPPGDLVSKA